MSSRVADKRIWIYTLKFLYLRWDDDSWRVRYPTEVKSAGFRFQLESSCVYSYTEELWYNETVCSWMTIYIIVLNLCIFFCKNRFLKRTVRNWNRQHRNSFWAKISFQQRYRDQSLAKVLFCNKQTNWKLNVWKIKSNNHKRILTKTTTSHQICKQILIKFTGYFRKNDIIWYVHSVSEKTISFRTLRTWSIIIQMIFNCYILIYSITTTQ